MFNRIDYFQPEQTTMVIPASSVSVFLDGVLCPVLEPIEIVRSQWPDFSRARLIFNTAADSECDFPVLENIENMFPKGKSLSIRAFYNGTAPADASVFNYSIFEGQIEKSEIKLKSDDWKTEVIARDYSAAMERLTVYGQRIIKDANSIFLQSFETVFNPDGKANASKTPVKLHGRNYKIFSADNKTAGHWKYAEVIQYLLSEYVTTGQLLIPSLERLLSLTDRQIVRDLDVTGLSLTDALHRCCERIGIKYIFVPVSEPNMPAQAIVFYKNVTGRKVEINCQKSGRVNISQTHFASLHSKENFWPVTHRYIGQGDFKVYEATFELIKAWDGSLEGNVYDNFSPSANPDFYEVRDVYRKWALNEASDYTAAPYNRGVAFDFSAIFQSSDYVPKRRRFYPCLTTDSQNRSLGYCLQISYDDGLTWNQYDDAFNLLADECGVWLSSDQLNIDLITASMNNQLRFRITASVISDEKLSAVVTDGPVNSAVPVVDHIVTLPRQFRYQKISGKSIFADNISNMLGIPDEADDSDALYEFIRHHSQSSSELIETIDIQTLIPGYDYEIGDIVVSSPDSRDLFSCRDGRSISIIENVQIDFQNQCTNLRIIRKNVL
ncbi:MAG: hypothetical protein JW787_11185 [Sedimentisphaerales bacterium]|nr:hypothetical protein [Sedimentisphaerales bacterium]